ncbi:hypothetical protein DI09_135p40 [Mitosporidium daphniae]|uniref:Uncharacterized protein n=1 Tax=Mitosporidium daphniae TaxID=1485682 RepID=A0A098VV06_9MICR|nr:uncharacterized protein DI09_135p40 [Mitosporidium daphniae]KGG52787.1 hypothetical protein DI09_135p40 [Mitosporidium daphniae]|eukprot:XP_013239223.1 uncharacterized protein DI09_135p40 [Mitosporidium daphniae]
MTEMLKCLSIADPVFSDIRFPKEASGIAIRVILETLLPQLPPHESIRNTLMHPPIPVSNSFIFSLLNELLELGVNVYAVEFISLIIDVFFVRLCVLDEFAPLILRLKTFVSDELQLLGHTAVIKNLLFAVDCPTASAHAYIREKKPNKPSYSYEAFEWRLMSRMLTSK